MAKKSTNERKAGVFIGGVIYGFTRRFFFDNKYVRKKKRKF